MQLWKGRFKKELSKTTNDFNSSISFDSRMYKEDIEGSIAHATMLGRCGIIKQEEADDIVQGLKGILADIENGTLHIDMEAEDIHTFIEGELTKRIGDNGKRLHTSRSRNDQVAVDIKLYLKKEVVNVKKLVVDLIKVIADKAEKYSETVMPGYTHLQRAQPITFGHHLLAYGEMLLRDVSRLEDCLKRMDEMPLGSCALAGTTYPIDRTITAELLGFERITNNSLDGVSDRDYCIEFASVLSIIMVHLSRFSEEIIMWCSWEFKFIELDDAFSTGSSIMPQKKNPDIAELVRGKSARSGHDGGGARLQKVRPRGLGRQRVGQTRQQLADLAVVKVHPLEGINDAPALHEHQIGVAAHQLDGQRVRDQVAHLVRAAEVKIDDAVPRLAAQLNEPPAGQVLAQQHTEARRRERVLEALLRQADAGRAAAGRQQQTVGLGAGAQGHKHLVAGRLKNFVDLGIEQRVFQFTGDQRQRCGIKGHGNGSLL